LFSQLLSQPKLSQLSQSLNLLSQLTQLSLLNQWHLLKSPPSQMNNLRNLRRTSSRMRLRSKRISMTSQNSLMTPARIETVSRQLLYPTRLSTSSLLSLCST